jgi:hypothetical protein
MDNAVDIVNNDMILHWIKFYGSFGIAGIFAILGAIKKDFFFNAFAGLWALITLAHCFIILFHK